MWKAVRVICQVGLVHDLNQPVRVLDVGLVAAVRRLEDTKPSGVNIRLVQLVLVLLGPVITEDALEPCLHHQVQFLMWAPVVASDAFAMRTLLVPTLVAERKAAALNALPQLLLQASADDTVCLGLIFLGKRRA